MMDTKAFEQILCVIPSALRGELEALGEGEKARIEEVRLRVGRTVSVLLSGEEYTVGKTRIERKHMEQLLELASRRSVHAVLGQLREGFLTIAGGHRVGFCGTAVLENGQVRMMRDISSACIRVAKAYPGISRQISPGLWRNGKLESTLILAPPGAGKTTMLRDLIRAISSGENYTALRVGVVDQRGELAALVQGEAQLDLGRNTDVLDGCPKAQGIMMLLRSMNPQVIAVDEITAPEDVAAMICAAGCGVTLLATAHGQSKEDLEQRPVYRKMMQEKIFRQLLTISTSTASSQRQYRLEVLG